MTFRSKYDVFPAISWEETYRWCESLSGPPAWQGNQPSGSQYRLRAEVRHSYMGFHVKKERTTHANRLEDQAVPRNVRVDELLYKLHKLAFRVVLDILDNP